MCGRASNLGFFFEEAIVLNEGAAAGFLLKTDQRLRGGEDCEIAPVTSRPRLAVSGELGMLGRPATFGAAAGLHGGKRRMQRRLLVGGQQSKCIAQLIRIGGEVMILTIAIRILDVECRG